MSAGLLGLLDDVAAIAKLAAASVDDVGAAAGRATAKAAGVVVDDTAVTPQYVHGVAADREIPIVKKIAKGSIRNKLLIILPIALILSQWAPWLLTPILMVGGTYLAFEGAEKIWGRIRGHEGHDVPAAVEGEDAEKTLVAGAVRTDLILSAEIMVIALYEVAGEGFWSRLAILFVVAIVITVVVYGVVALIVKMDDLGLALAGRSSAFSQRLGRGLVSGMPKVLAVVSAVGTVAMLWVGGHILLQGVDELGWHAPYDLVHHAEEAIAHAVPGVGGVLAWLFNTLCSALVGLVVGAVVVAIMHVLPFGKKEHAPHDVDVHASSDEEAGTPVDAEPGTSHAERRPAAEPDGDHSAVRGRPDTPSA
jgi:predicted DNA repair protein MutK